MASVQLDLTYTDFELKCLQKVFGTHDVDGSLIPATPAEVKAALEGQIREFVTTKTAEYRRARLTLAITADQAAVDAWVDANCPDTE